MNAPSHHLSVYPHRLKYQAACRPRSRLTPIDEPERDENIKRQGISREIDVRLVKQSERICMKPFGTKIGCFLDDWLCVSRYVKSNYKYLMI